MFIRSKIDGKKVIRGTLNGEICWRGYRYLYDDFTSTEVDTDLWDIVDPSNTNDYSIVNGQFRISNESGTTGSSNVPVVGIVSKITFPIGTVIRTRVRNPLGRHASIVAMSKDIPTSPFPHSGTVPAISIYSREDNNTIVYGSYRDELGNTGSLDRTSDNIREFEVVELRRELDGSVTFYRDSVLVHTTRGAVFTGDYFVYFMVDSWTLTTKLDIDWVEVIGPIE